MKELDLFSVPLKGQTLIEASAGTGKTWSIIGIFLRLLLEQKIGLNQILVVTFTNAAADELRLRIRERIEYLCHVLSKKVNTKDEDPLVKAMSQRFSNDPSAIRILTSSLRDFDQASIFTIHGFCNQLLREFAFETGSPFNAELVTDHSRLIQEVCEDYWRIHLYSSPVEFVRYCMDRINGPKGFSDMFIRNQWATVRILPKVSPAPLTHLEIFRNQLEELKKLWQASQKPIHSILITSDLNRVRYSLKKVDILMGMMDDFLNGYSTGYPIFEGFNQFSSACIQNSIRKTGSRITHPFFDLCESFMKTSRSLEVEMHHQFISLKAGLFSYAPEALKQKKQIRTIRFYDDLLLLVRQALRGDGRKRLINSVSRKYQAALVDEFQDTDPIQYDIFSSLFRGEGKAFFMIGDPKQAIYGFRGADIFSYIKASDDAKKKYTLTQNFRSVPKLVSAVNTIFGSIKAPFLFEKIPFPQGRTAFPEVIKEDRTDPPMKLWFIPGKDSLPISKDEAIHLISKGVGIEIISLVQRHHVEPRDIAILTRTHRQARILKEALAGYSIPAVLICGDSVFDSHEAMEMERLLIGISDPINPVKVKAALITDMMGFNANDLYSETDEPDRLENALIRFREYHELWRSNGFIPMFTRLIKQEKVKQRLIRFKDGERRVTNLLHLSELLHHATDVNGFPMEGLIQWLSENRNATLPRMEEYQLRLESDENAVTIVTIHKSKGLEYPVVFSPFSWEGPVDTKGELVFHDASEGLGKILDLNPDPAPENRLQAWKEELAETIRLLYVALTRAKKRCYLVWGRINGAQTSPMLHLFHGNRDSGFEKSPAELLNQKTDEDLLKDLQNLAESSQESIEILPLPCSEKEVLIPIRPAPIKPLLRTFTGNISTEWKITSYSSLVSEGIESEGALEPDSISLPSDIEKDQEKEPFSSDPLSFDIFSFPKGSRSGIFFHKLFETLDYGILPHNQSDEISELINAHGIDMKWKETVIRTAKRILYAPLNGVFGEILLSKIPRSNRIHEMEFYFPLNRITPVLLKSVFAKFHTPLPEGDVSTRIGNLIFSPREGFMKGYMDLVFFHKGRAYLLDWKSNYLGAEIESYGKKQLDQAMKHSYYFLQYYIYTLAVSRYLKLRNPAFNYKTDFGGIFYLFIRGIHPEIEKNAGIYYALPDLADLKALETTLIPASSIYI